MKNIFLIAMAGHILCGFTDCLFTYGPNGKVDLTALKDYDKAYKNFEGMTLKNLMLGMLLGVLALTMSVFGYIGLADWMSDFSKTYAVIMYIATVVYFLSIVSHYVFCGTVEWFFVRLGRTREALSKLIQEKTVLIIAHRMRTIANADKVVVLKDGVVAEQGTPKELGKKNGIYKHMSEMQLKVAEWRL